MFNPGRKEHDIMNPPQRFLVIILSLLLVGPTPSLSRTHVISFRSPNLYPESLVWDPSADHFLVGSLRTRTILSVSDAGVAQTFVSDTSLPLNSTILGLALDTVHHRLLAVVRALDLDPPLNALAAYDLRSHQRLFLTRLPPAADASAALGQGGANDVTVDFDGNAYVTNSLHDFIWKVSKDGEASIFSRSPAFTAHAEDQQPPYGLNGIAYVSTGHLLVVQTNTGKMYKVDADDGTARRVMLSEELTLADGIAVRRDGVVLVVSRHALRFLKSQDGWGEAVVFDKTTLRAEGFPTSVVAGKEDRAYVLYGHVDEGTMGNAHREVFGIEEVKSESESADEKVWIYVLLGLGLVYFTVWRFQMKKLAQNMNRKIN